MIMALYRNKEWLKQKYVDEGWSATDISAHCGVSHKTICRWLHKFGIPTRGPQLSQLAGPKRQKRMLMRTYISDYIRQHESTIK